ncbi:unnamed protein product [Linum tenue]|uniref:Uncharacterized protein n=1 Tax=Linum tenue TaxID=586396 RepID=A0AAV0IFW4_9ROSI|nr:unnamed protein product [Linum tenue]
MYHHHDRRTLQIGGSLLLTCNGLSKSWQSLDIGNCTAEVCCTLWLIFTDSWMLS